MVRRSTLTRSRFTAAPTSKLRRYGRLRGRAATMLEFTLVLPMFVFMMLFTVDMGTLMLASGAMNDAAFSSARAGAQAGGAGFVPGEDRSLCPSNGNCGGGASFDSAVESYDMIPLGDAVDFDSADFRVESGATCVAGTVDSYVTVKMPYTVELMTPGLEAITGIGTGADAAGKFTLVASGVARCEIYRRN